MISPACDKHGTVFVYTCTKLSVFLFYYWCITFDVHGNTISTMNYPLWITLWKKIFELFKNYSDNPIIIIIQKLMSNLATLLYAATQGTVNNKNSPYTKTN